MSSILYSLLEVPRLNPPGSVEVGAKAAATVVPTAAPPIPKI